MDGAPHQPSLLPHEEEDATPFRITASSSSSSSPLASSNSKPVRCIVKLGGAAITHKDKFEAVDDEKLAVACAHLRQSMLHSSTSLPMDWSRRGSATQLSVPPELEGQRICTDAFVVVHGAGSFGHFQASKSGVNRGGLGVPLVDAGFVATRISVTKLNLEVVRALALEGIPAVGVSPFSAGWSTYYRALEYDNVALVKQIVNAGFIPVLHGDAVLDRGQGCTILSGDVIVRKLAHELKPDYAVFLTNVPGVFDRPPSEPDAVLLEEIVVHEGGSWEIVKPCFLETKTGVKTTSAAHDTTGGMATKIVEAAAIAMSGVDVYIVEVGTDHALEALKGSVRSGPTQNWVGTLVRASI